MKISPKCENSITNWYPITEMLVETDCWGASTARGTSLQERARGVGAGSVGVPSPSAHPGACLNSLRFQRAPM